MIAPRTIAGVVLAGGRSSRMGGADKPLREIAGKPMLSHVIDRLRPQVSHLAINANGDAQRFAGFELPVIADRVADFAGPLAGILAGMDWAADKRNVARLASGAGDTPFFPADLVNRLIAAAEGDPRRIAIAAANGRAHPVFGLWPLSLREPLREFLENGEHKVMAFVEANDFVSVDFPMLKRHGRAIDPFFNVNTETELEEAGQIYTDLVS